jgi:hypothetical protein
MEKNQERISTLVLEPEKHIEINGVTITPEFLSIIKSWQEEDNGVINEIRDDIANVTSSILLAMEYIDHDAIQKDMLEQIKALNSTRTSLKFLMKYK